jgi:hypothetical protein
MQVTHDSLSMIIYQEEEEDGCMLHIAVDNIVRMEMVSKTFLCHFSLQKLSPKLPLWCAWTTNSSIFDTNIFIVPPR